MYMLPMRFASIQVLDVNPSYARYEVTCHVVTDGYASDW